MTKTEFSEKCSWQIKSYASTRSISYPEALDHLYDMLNEDYPPQICRTRDETELGQPQLIILKVYPDKWVSLAGGVIEPGIVFRPTDTHEDSEWVDMTHEEYQQIKEYQGI